MVEGDTAVSTAVVAEAGLGSTGTEINPGAEFGLLAILFFMYMAADNFSK